MFEDRILIFRIKHGDAGALVRIYAKYAEALIALAYKLVHNSTVAEDLLHDVFLDFVEGIYQFRLTGSLKGYLACCVANRAKDWLRSADRNTKRSAEMDTLRSVGRSPEQTVMEHEDATLVNDAIDQLPIEQREVVLLHLLGGMTFRQIAEQQGISINTIQGRYRYGLHRLRDRLNVDSGREVCRECRTTG
jgi:RNA polymerase sigma factor (sigma-70 family)